MLSQNPKPATNMGVRTVPIKMPQSYTGLSFMLRRLSRSFFIVTLEGSYCAQEPSGIQVYGPDFSPSLYTVPSGATHAALAGNATNNCATIATNVLETSNAIESLPGLMLGF